MAILLTNGQFYVAHNKKGSIIKVRSILLAQDFYSIEKAVAQKNKAPSKLKQYYYIDTSVPRQKETVQKEKSVKIKRKKFSDSVRKAVYEKSSGCCQLCGRKLTIEDYSIDHIIPLDGGGTNDIDNLQGTCKVCNNFKANIYPEQFLDRITEIFMFQMEKQYGDNTTWKMARNMLMEIL